MTSVVIRHAKPQDETQWRVLWHNYNIFYEAPKITEVVTASTWERILSDTSAISCLVAEEAGMLKGFIHYVIHPRTWSTRDTCYMEDLYVAPEARGRGIARRLCATLKAICMEKNLSRIYWNTAEGNAIARTFYDTIATKDDFIRYVMLLP
jgi:GNAT superfamily N-acetyltransferase